MRYILKGCADKFFGHPPPQPLLKQLVSNRTIASNVKFYLGLSIEFEVKILKPTLKEAIKFCKSRKSYHERDDKHKSEMTKIIQDYSEQVYGKEINEDSDDDDVDDDEKNKDYNQSPICGRCYHIMKKVEFQDCYDNKGKKFVDMKKIVCNRGMCSKYIQPPIECTGDTDQEKQKTLLWHCERCSHNFCIDCGTQQVKQ